MSTKLFASFAAVSLLFAASGCATATDPLAGDDGGGVVDSGGGGGDTSTGGDTTVPPGDTKADAPASDAPCVAPSKTCGSKCTDVTKDPANCGACGKACAAGVVCVDGGCKASCGTDTVSCDGTCVNLLTDKDHCGACTTKCPTDSVCVDAKCKLSCTAPQIDCGVGKCIDLKTDKANCGSCLKSCTTDQSCTAGVCGCAAGKTTCSGRCVDTMTDNNNCGTCGTFCSTFSSMACTGGKCVCTGGKTSCGGSCVDTTSDDANCGACGTVCDAAASKKCHGGTCTLDCGTTGTICGGVCKFTSSDPANCGACGTTCAAGQFCSAGVCTCTSGLTNCGGVCVDLKADGSNCGFCSRVCAAGTVCSGGGCGTSCGGGRSACGSSCLDLSNDPKNCGSCGTVCATGLCGGGACLTAPPCKATGPYQVLFYGPTKTGFTTASEQTFLPAGSVVTTADATMWSAMAASDFAKYDLIVVGEGGVCPGATAYDTLFATRAVWTTAILGRIVVTEQDPVFHAGAGKTGADTFLRAALQWAAGGPGTGLYVGSECGARKLDFLSPFGGIASTSGSGDSVHIVVPSSGTMIGSTDASLSTWGSSYHGQISSWPADWTSVATGGGTITVTRDKVCAP